MKRNSSFSGFEGKFYDCHRPQLSCRNHAIRRPGRANRADDGLGQEHTIQEADSLPASSKALLASKIERSRAMHRCCFSFSTSAASMGAEATVWKQWRQIESVCRQRCGDARNSGAYRCILDSQKPGSAGI